MFTGIVEAQGSIVRLDPVGEGVEVELEVGEEFARGVRVGDSIALNGSCLTVTTTLDSRLTFQAVPETLKRTSLGAREVGDRMNVERSLRADGRLDGHIVQGHVDGTGVVRELRKLKNDVWLRIECAQELVRMLVPKGSVAIDGVSLTVVDPGTDAFSVALIPHTLGVTTLGERRPEDLVNLELDVLGKYVFRYMDQLREGSG